MILEGRVHVTMGKENLAFESGPFSYFGIQALVMPPSESEFTSPAPGITEALPVTGARCPVTGVCCSVTGVYCLIGGMLSCHVVTCSMLERP